jgi:site-specific recombinase XerD
MGAGMTATAGGPLAGLAAGIRARLLTLGYALSTIAEHERTLSKLSDWLAEQALDTDALSEATLDRFLAWYGTRWAGTARTSSRLRVLVGLLRESTAIPPAPLIEPSPAARMLTAYRDYLLSERRLAAVTVDTHTVVIRRFLGRRPAVEGLGLEALTVAEVHRFVLGEADRLTVGSVRSVVDVLRSFLRFTFITD